MIFSNLLLFKNLTSNITYMNREELKQKLREKLHGFKNKRTSNNSKDTTNTYEQTNNINNMPIKQKKKLMADAKKEIAKLKEDTRITPHIKELYSSVVKEFNKIKIPSPIELLNNPELAKQKFKEYLVDLIESCKKNNIQKEIFIELYLNSTYTKYHVELLGREVVPEKLRDLLNF